MRVFKVELGGFQPWMWANNGDLGGQHKVWTQQPEHWTLFFFEHDGTIVVNNRPIPYHDGNVGFVPPGTKVEFDRVGSNTAHYSLTFGLTKRSETVVIPAVADLGDATELRRKEFEATWEWLHVSIMRGLACAFNTLWSIAQPIHVWRKSDLVFDAERLIVDRIATKLVVADLAAELGISHAHLLRLFREEHSMTIQEFIRDKRAEIARQMITGTQMSLKEIAIRTGMADLQYFNKIVRSSTGLSPRALREMAQKRTQH